MCLVPFFIFTFIWKLQQFVVLWVILVSEILGVIHIYIFGSSVYFLSRLYFFIFIAYYNGLHLDCICIALLSIYLYIQSALQLFF